MTNNISEQIIDEARLGDRSAIDRLVKAAEVIMRRLTHQVSQADADDVVQNSLMRVNASIHQLTDPSHFSSWCAAIARNELRMFYRASARREQAQLKFGFEPQLSNDPIGKPDIRSAMQRLSSSQQLLIHQLYVTDQSYEEISDAWGIPVSAVKSRLHRARNRLRQEIDMQSQAKPIKLNKEDIESLHFAAQFHSRESDRTHLTGVLLDQSGFAVGTDGKHLVIRSVPALRGLSANLLVDSTSLKAIDDEADLTVHLDEVQLTSKTEQVALSVREETFPDYHAVLQENQPVSCLIAHRKLCDLIRTVSANLSTVKGTTDTILLSIDLDQQKLRLRSDHTTSPESEFSISYELALDTPSNQLGFVKLAVNIHLLSECVAAVDGETVELRATSWNRPLDVLGQRHRSVLMPIKI